MTSRTRGQAAMRRQPVDGVPCAPLQNVQPADPRRGRRWQFPFATNRVVREDSPEMIARLCGMALPDGVAQAVVRGNAARRLGLGSARAAAGLRGVRERDLA